MKRLAFISVAIILLILLGYLFTSTFTKKPVAMVSSTPSSLAQLPIAGTKVINNSPQIVIKTQQGDVTVRNFYQTANRIYYESDKTTVNDVVLVSPDKYNLDYVAYKNRFDITLLSQPFTTSRQQAQQALLNILGITQQEACKLNVLVQVQPTLSPANAGRNFGLSFCPGSLSL